MRYVSEILKIQQKFAFGDCVINGSVIISRYIIARARVARERDRLKKLSR